ncbi:MAG: di-trans,poly-cis-decaprenylcistransferase [Bdellovibrio sp.]|nr:di-trans,poly-cis-decaprenylcistransferase [Bdellovibrio sp.]
MSEQQLNHIAIIMDGNGRWATMRGRPRVWGHIRGSSKVASIVEEADRLGIKALTLYAFSSENWSRPFSEVRVLFALLKKFICHERERIIRNKIRFKIIGDISELPQGTQDLIHDLEQVTAHHQGLKLTFAFGYGGRAELVHAVNQFITHNPGQKISEKDLNNCLYCPDLGDVDLLIRTGGDCRVSNFLLWQLAYAELYFTETKWPDFSVSEFARIVDFVTRRERRFGTIGEVSDLNEAQKLAEKNRVNINQQLGMH